VPFVSTGDSARRLAANECLEPTRENLGTISARYLTERRPGCFLRMAAVKIAAYGWPVAGISGTRSADDVRLLKSAFGRDFVLAHVVVSEAELPRPSAQTPGDCPVLQIVRSEGLVASAANTRLYGRGKELAPFVAGVGLCLVKRGFQGCAGERIASFTNRMDMVSPSSLRTLVL
jgi:hypothetical protein